jgi:membrane fusion protein (multidrug efflux system)
MTKRNKIFVAIGTVVFFIVVYFVYQAVMYVTTDNAQVEAHAVMLAPKVAGFVSEVKVTEGQKVKKDDILVEIDDRDYQNTLRQVQGEKTSIEARKTDADKNFKRIAELYSKGAVSQQQYDTSAANNSDIKAKYDSISAQVAQAELNLENTKIKAPSNGFIAKKSAEVGQLASPGVPLIGFVDADERWIIANFKETDVESIVPGHAVEIDIDAISHKTFKGVVDSVSSATGATFTMLPPDNATGNFTKVVQRVPVKIKFTNLNDDDIELLKAGLSANVKVHKHK